MVGTSDTPDTNGVTSESAADTPRALVHRKILDVAASNPNASMEAVADDVSGASTSLVERVLDEYGDPGVESDQSGVTDGNGHGTGPNENGHDGTAEVTDTGGSSGSTPSQSAAASATGGAAEVDDDGSLPESGTDAKSNGAAEADGQTVIDDTDPSTEADPVEELTEKQRETLRAVAANPTATQQVVADELGVTRATVSRRLGTIDGFDWQSRAEFVDRIFDDVSTRSESTGDRGPESDTATAEAGDGGTSTASPTASQAAIADIQAQVDAIASRLDAEADEADESEPVDPELVRKVVHACMDAEYVSKEEELEVLGLFLGDEAGR